MINNVISDVFGVSGIAMLKALISEDKDIASIANLAKRKLRQKISELKEA